MQTAQTATTTEPPKTKILRRLIKKEIKEIKKLVFENHMPRIDVAERFGIGYSTVCAHTRRKTKPKTYRTPATSGTKPAGADFEALFGLLADMVFDRVQARFKNSLKVTVG